MKTERQPPREYKTLDDLFAQAAHYAEWNFRDHGCMNPAFFVISADGPPAFFAHAKDFGDERSKNELVQTAQLFALAHGATMSVIALEVWTMARSPEARKLEPDEMPSEAPDRIEVVCLLGETSEHGNRIKFLRIIRHDNGDFFNLADAEDMSDFFNLGGRFSRLIGPATAPADLRALAAMALTVRGVKIAGIAPRGK